MISICRRYLSHDDSTTCVARSLEHASQYDRATEHSGPGEPGLTDEDG